MDEPKKQPSIQTMRRLVQALIVWLVAGLLWLGSALAATVNLRPAEAKAKMAEAALEIATLRSNIVLTLQMLDQVRNPTDRQAQFQKFGTQLDLMEEQAKLTRERARAMQQRGDAYFAEWEARTAALTDPEKRRLAESRYSVRKRSYEHITKCLQEARSNFEPLLGHLREIQKLLGNPDATRVTAAKDLFMHANWRCIDVQRSLMEAEVEFQFLASDFAQNET